MEDGITNFYDVCKETEKYFEGKFKGKGSGWKGYQRWKHWHEPHYYPSGERDNVDPYFLDNAFQDFLRNNPQSKNFPSNGWRDLGPYSANNITEGYNPGIGRVECFYVNRNNTQHIYLGSRSGGFWRTFNGGASWQNTTDFLFASGVNAMDATPGHPDSVLINVRNASNGTSHGIYRSSDAGATWTPTNFIPSNLGWGGLGSSEQVYKIAYHPTIPGLVFIGTSRGLYRSTNNLQTWTLLLPNADITDIEFHTSSPNIIYLYDNYYWGTNRSVVLRSTDFGMTFTSSATIPGNNDSEGFIAVTPVCPNCVFFASDNGVWRSNDAGQNFTFLSNPDESCDGFAVSDVDTSYMIYGYLNLEGTTDGGYTFNEVTDWANTSPDTTYTHADLRAAECINGVFYVGTDGYLAMTPNNGTAWYRLSDGTGVREFYAVGLSQSNWNVQMAGSQDNGTSILDVNGWIEWNGGDGMEAIVQPLNDQWMIGSWQFGTRQITRDGGATREGIGSPNGGNGDWQAPLMFDPNLQMKVYHCMDSLYVSDEFGDGWYAAGSPGFVNSTNIEVAAIAENNSNIIVVSAGAEIRLSQNGGASFNSIAAGLPAYSITDIAFAPHNDNIIVVTFARYQNDNQKVYISYNRGVSWSNITYNLGNMPIRSVVIDHTDAANIYVGAEIGVFYKPLIGNTWTLYNPGLPNVSVNDLEIQYGANTLRAATWGRGLWDYNLVGRSDFPSILITNITDPPTKELPKVGVPQDVSSIISYNGNLTSVYTLWSVNAPTFDSLRTMSNIQDSTWQTINPIPSYPAGTKIYFKVFAVGTNGDTTETYKFMYTVRAMEYCGSTGNMSYTTAMTYVDFAGIQRVSGKTQPYTDYTATDSATVFLSFPSNYNLIVNLDTDGNYTIYSKVWIDWNQDYDFDDIDEEYNMGTTQNSSNGLTSLSPLALFVPSHALPGKTRMRVGCQYAAAPTACMSGVDGEVEDYTVIVFPNSLNITSIEENKMRVFPNPTDGYFSLDLGKVYENIYLEITDISGKRILSQQNIQNQILNLQLNQAAGVYILKVTADSETEVFKLILR